MDKNIMKETARIINECLEDQGIVGEKINLESKLADMGINSISFIKLIVALESEFGIEFDDEYLELNRMPTLSCVIDYIQTKQKE